jgi:hypothetical protein
LKLRGSVAVWGALMSIVVSSVVVQEPARIPHARCKQREKRKGRKGRLLALYTPKPAAMG